jgi:hypothetical protein
MNGDRGVLRLLRFRGAGPEVLLDAALREAVGRASSAMPGLLGSWAGRRRADDSDERCVVTVSTAEDTLRSPLLERLGLGDLEGGHLSVDLIEDVTLPLCIAVSGDRDVPPRILRIVHGTTRQDQLPRYVQAVEAGAAADVAARHGPLRLYLAQASSDEFLTVSAWAAWGDVEVSTGGDARHPDATRHAELLRTTTVDHFELLAEDTTGCPEP